MSACAVVDSNGFLRVTGEQICTEFQLLTNAEVSQLQTSTADLLGTLDGLFAFDLSTFGLVHGSLMLAFISGHIAGRIVKTLGKK